MPDIFEIDNHAAFGKLIEKWVRGILPRPLTFAEFTDQLEDHGINYLLPDGENMPELTNIKYNDLDNTALTISIPTIEMLEVGLANATASDSEYRLPTAYDKAYVNTERRDDLTADERREMLYARIGDYSVGSCM
tara:strand:+ start:171 stop:575 length:405 start_codon:yes stop_codon:yes gene_type:complete